MNLNFCVRWPQPIASGANNGGHRKAETGKLVSRLPVSCRVANRQSAVGNRNSNEPHKHHRAADFRRHSGVFPELRSGTTQKFKAGVYRLLAPFLTGGSGIKKQITSVRSGLKSLDELEHENAALQVENRELRATNQGLRDVEHEVNRLRHALNYRERSVFKLVAAEVIARDSSSWWRTLTINRGKRDAIETDMPVVTDVGLVGKTTTVSDTISVVLLVSDENCRIAASVEGSREQGIVSGERVTGWTHAAFGPEFSVKAG